MIIEYKNDTIKITHPSKFVQILTTKDLDEQKQQTEAQILLNTKKLQATNTDISLLTKP